MSSLTDEDAGCKFAIAAPLFLFMKDKFSDGFRIDSKFINYAKKFELECSVAVYLLGLTLGYDRTYDAYYDSIKLSIFGTQHPTKIETIHHTPITEERMLFPNEQSVNDKREPIAWLYRKKKPSYSPAFNKDEIKRLEGEGYKVLKSLSDIAKKEIAKQGYEIPSPEE